jgi:hypothetical protein
MKNILFALVALALTLTACNPRDPQQLSNDQKASNYCHKPENKNLAACQELAKVNSNKPFISAGTELPTSAYMIERQSEAFRYLQMAIDIAKGQALVDGEKCLSILVDPSGNQTQVVLNLDECSVSTESGTVTTSGQYTYFIKQNGSNVTSVQLETTNLTTSYKSKDSSVSVAEVVIFSADFHENSAFVTRYDVNSKATISRKKTADEIVDLSFHGIGEIDILANEFSSRVDKWSLNYSSYFEGKSDKSAFTFRLFNLDKNANKETFENGCANRNQSYTADFKISFKSLAFENADLTVKGRELSLKTQAANVEAKVLGFGKCSEAPSHPVLRTQINWANFLPL